MFNNRCVSSVLFQLFFTSLRKEFMITIHLRYYINSTHARFLAADLVFLFFHLISGSHLSHSSFTNCKLHTHMLTVANLWRVRCSPINSCITKLKRPGTRSNRWGPDPANHLKYRPELVRVPREDLYLAALPTPRAFIFICKHLSETFFGVRSPLFLLNQLHTLIACAFYFI